MCGRYVVAYDPQTLVSAFSLTRSQPFAQRWNITPQSAVPVVFETRPGEGAAERVCELMRWGLVPHWARDAGVGAPSLFLGRESEQTISGLLFLPGGAAARGRARAARALLRLEDADGDVEEALDRAARGAKAVVAAVGVGLRGEASARAGGEVMRGEARGVEEGV
jgi:hypothetical protein